MFEKLKQMWHETEDMAVVQRQKAREARLNGVADRFQEKREAGTESYGKHEDKYKAEKDRQEAAHDELWTRAEAAGYRLDVTRTRGTLRTAISMGGTPYAWTLYKGARPVASGRAQYPAQATRRAARWLSKNMKEPRQ